jgi:hypothetical protein
MLLHPSPPPPPHALPAPRTPCPQSPRASTKDIKDAYRALMKDVHPDLSQDEESTEFAALLNEVGRGGGPGGGGEWSAQGRAPRPQRQASSP